MREIQPRRPEPVDRELWFYTIRPEDVGKTVIHTEEGPLNMTDSIGWVLRIDIGRRLYGRVDNCGVRNWQRESEQQYAERVRHAEE
jgi:hypothetical protein